MAISLLQEIKIVAEYMEKEYKLDYAVALKIINESFFPSLLEMEPDYIQHYTSDYWAELIGEEYLKKMKNEPVSEVAAWAKLIGEEYLKKMKNESANEVAATA